MDKNHDLLTGLYSAFNTRDIEAILTALHPGVDWPSGAEGGRIHGHNSVREYWRRQWNEIDHNVEPLRFGTDELGRTIVDVHQVVRDLAGKVISDQIFQHVYDIQSSLVRSMHIRKP